MLIHDFIDRCHSLASLYLPPAAFGSVPVKIGNANTKLRYICSGVLLCCIKIPPARQWYSTEKSQKEREITPSGLNDCAIQAALHRLFRDDNDKGIGRQVELQVLVASVQRYRNSLNLVRLNQAVCILDVF